MEKERSENVKRCFLGGTCNGSVWRDRLIPELRIAYFNPVVENWTPECQERELKEREECDICLYLITPKMTGVYSIAEAVEDSIKRPAKTVFKYITTDEDKEFEPFQVKSLEQVGKMIERNGGWFVRLGESLAELLNEM
jgi:hypothetical protein